MWTSQQFTNEIMEGVHLSGSFLPPEWHWFTLQRANSLILLIACLVPWQTPWKPHPMPQSGLRMERCLVQASCRMRKMWLKDVRRHISFVPQEECAEYLEQSLTHEQLCEVLPILVHCCLFPGVNHWEIRAVFHWENKLKKDSQLSVLVIKENKN